MDANLADIPPVVNAINDLRLGGIYVVSLLVAAACVGTWLWFRNKRAEEKAEQAKLSIEQQAKTERANQYTKSWGGVEKALVEMRKTLDVHNQASAVNARQLGDSISALNASIQMGLAKQLTVLETLLSNSRGVMTTDDSLRLIETTFENFIAPEFARVAAISITKNSYAERKTFVRDSVVARLSALATKAQKSLDEYTMAIPADLFFSVDKATGEFELVLYCWELIKAVHENKTHDVGHASGVYAEHVSIQVSNAVKTFYLDGQTRALDIYHRPETSGPTKRYPSSPDIK